MDTNKIIQPVKRFIGLPSVFFAGLVRLYQMTISPDHGWLRHFFHQGYCRYQPTCSEYCRQSLLKHGLIGGSILGLARILHCNPWSAGGVDEVPAKKSFNSLKLN